jgi:hypothetical protein
MVEKKFYKSKTFWGAFLVVVSAIFAAVGLPELSQVVVSFGGALGLVGLRDAKGKLKWD